MVTVYILELETAKRGALVSITQEKESLAHEDSEVGGDHEASSNIEVHPDWQFERGPDATNYVLEQSHIFVTEQTASLIFSFHTYETQEPIGAMAVPIAKVRHVGAKFMMPSGAWICHIRA